MKITEQQGMLLIRLARQTIAGKLDIAVSIAESVDEKLLQEPCFQQKLGVFVTLHKNGQLRGCIGSLSGSAAIVDGVRDNAVNAAFKDYRFSPVSRDEFDQLDLEVSILSEPQELDYNTPDDLLAKLHSGEDGVIIRKGGASATFLPQVWKQLPDKAAFLSHLCQKAGLPHDQWQKGDLQVRVYRVQYFAEKNR